VSTFRNRRSLLAERLDGFNSAGRLLREIFLTATAFKLNLQARPQERVKKIFLALTVDVPVVAEKGHSLYRQHARMSGVKNDRKIWDQEN